jgi:hypothetical protein
MENHLDCPLCQKSISYAGFHKHIFSSAHKDDLEALIIKRKPYLLKYIEGKDHTVMPYVIPDPKKSTTTLKICYGCKKAFISKSYFKNHLCPHTKDQLQWLKDILAKETSVDVVVTPSEDVSKIKKDNDRLKKELQLIKEDNDKLSGFEQAFINLIKSYKQHIPYDSFITTLEDEDSVLYDSIIGYLDDE